MGFRIEGGNGGKNELSIDSDGRALVVSHSQGVEYSAAEKGNSYSIFANCNIEVTEAKSGLFYFKNLESNGKIHITRVFINSENIGGNGIYLQILKNPEVSTSDTGSTILAINKDFNSNKKNDLDIRQADTTDLEFESIGTALHKMRVMEYGNMLMDFDGSIILSQNNSFGLRWLATQGAAPTDGTIINVTLNYVFETS